MAYTPPTTRTTSTLITASIWNTDLVDNIAYLYGIIESGYNAWTVAGDAFVYVSATSVKIVGVDKTAKYTLGTRIKFTQGTPKYFYVVSSAFGTDTTITLTAGTDFTVADSAISAPYFSYGNPPDFPYFFNFTPGTRTGYSLAAGTEVIRYAMNGTQVILEYNLAAVTSTGTNFEFSLPLAAKSITNMRWGGANGTASDNGSTLTTATRWDMNSGATSITFHANMGTGTWTNGSTKGVRGIATYEAA